MKKVIVTSLLVFLSTTALAVGPVFEKGRSPNGNASCEPPLTRVDGTVLNIGDLINNVVTTTNVDNGTSVPDITDIYCSKEYAWSEMETGQYEVTARAVDVDGRESAETPVFSFLLIPAISPPNAPSNFIIQ